MPNLSLGFRAANLMKPLKSMVLPLVLAACLLACESRDQAADYVNQGMAQTQKGEWQKAITSFTRALELDPKNAASYLYRGLAFEGQGELNRAIDDFNQALELKTQYPGVVYYNRGLAYAKLGKMDQALADFNRVLELDPKDLEGYINRGRVYLIQGNFGRAISDYDQVLKLNPKYLRAYTRRGLAYYQQGDWDRAFADLNRALELDPKDSEALYHKADLLDKAGRSKEAPAAYRAFLKYAPPEAGRYIQRAQERIKALENQAGN